MVQEVLIVRASISSALLKSTLFRGFILAFIGALILLLAGVFMSAANLHQWGWSLFLASLGLIAGGLIPYRRLARLQLKPDELTMVDAYHLIFYSKGKKILTLPLQSIAQMSYASHPKRYGIAVWLKPAPIAPIVIHQSPKEVQKMRQQGRQIGQADLFFPYFNQRAYDELMDWQYEETDEESI